MQRNRFYVMYILLIFLAIGCAKQMSSNGPIISPDKIVAAWLFDEDYDQIAVDSSGNGHDGNLEEYPVRVPGKFGTALQFGADGDAVVIPDFGESVPGKEVTVVAWVKLEDVKNQDLFILVPLNRIGHWRSEIGNRFAVHFPWNKPKHNAIHWQFGGKQITLNRPSNTLGRWEHWAFVCSTSQNFMKIYRNGSEVASNQNASHHFPHTADLRIGGRPKSSWGGTFGGIIDEFAVFSVALGEREIKALMKGIRNVILPMRV